MPCKCRRQECKLSALLCPVYELRVPDRSTRVRVLMANGRWSDNPEEWGLAAYGQSPFGYWAIWGIEQHPDYEWQWCQHNSWSLKLHQHKYGNPWHTQLREGVGVATPQCMPKTHPNELAYDIALTTCVRIHGTGAGQRAKFEIWDGFMSRGQVRRLDTRAIVTFPTSINCFRCSATIDVTDDIRNQPLKGKDVRNIR